MAGRTEPAAFARERQEVLVLVVIAADPGEATFEGAAVDEFFQAEFPHSIFPRERALICFIAAGNDFAGSG